MAENEVLRGRLSYRRQSTGEVRGREDWTLTYHGDGSRTLRSLARTDDSGFLRDVVYTLGADGRPQDVLLRLRLAERWIGSGYLRVEGDRLEVVADSAQDGRVEQRLRVAGPLHVLTHAVMLDGWTFWAYDDARGGEQTVTVYNTSSRWDGTDGPAGRLEPLRVERLADGELAVAAGRFPCRSFRVVSDAIGSPPAHLWVTGEHCLLVRYDWPGLDLEYVLESLTVGD